MRNFAIASLIGVAATLLLLAGAFLADSAGHTELSKLLFWQNGLLQSGIPPHNIGTPEKPINEGTPVNFLGFLVSIPLGFFIYGCVAYAAIKGLRRGT